MASAGDSSGSAPGCCAIAEISGKIATVQKDRRKQRLVVLRMLINLSIRDRPRLR
jgi:hypothetical protein